MNYWGGDIPWVSLHDTESLDGREIVDTKHKVTQEGIKNSSARVLPAGTVVFSRTATVGKSTILARKMATSQDFANFVCGERIYNRYLMQLLRGMTREWHRLMAGSTHNTIYMPAFQSLLIALPPRREQEKISEILSSCDATIDQTRALITAKQQRKKFLMQKLLTGTKRLPGFKEEWKSHHCGTLCERVTRKNKKGCSNVLTISGTLGLVSQEEYFNKRIAGKDVSGYFLLKRGELAYNKSSSHGYPFGAIKMLTRYEEGVVSTLYICFRLQPGAADPSFVQHFFESHEFNRELYAIAQEGARNHGLLNVSPDEFFNTLLHFPPLAEQRAISKVLTAAASEITLLEEKHTSLQLLRRGLMQKLLTGEIRVKP